MCPADLFSNIIVALGLFSGDYKECCILALNYKVWKIHDLVTLSNGNNLLYRDSEAWCGGR